MIGTGAEDDRRREPGWSSCRCLAHKSYQEGMGTTRANQNESKLTHGFESDLPDEKLYAHRKNTPPYYVTPIS